MSKDATPYATADIETDPFKKGGRYPSGRLPVAFASCFFDGKLSTVFEGKQGSASDCCRALVSACVKFPGIIYLHSGGKFDLHFLLTYILEHFSNEDITPTCIGPRMVALKTPVCEFRDSYSLIPKPLKSLTTAAKKEIEFWKLEEFAEDLTEKEAKQFWHDVTVNDITERKIWPSPRQFYRDEIVAYLRQDCTGLFDAVSEFVGLYGRHLTLPGAAFSVLKKQFSMPTVRTRRKYDDLFRPFYFAGRVQFFALGKLEGNYKILDINSAFPAAMMEEHWFSPGYTVTEEPPKENPERSFYEITCDSLGALPVRTKKGVEFPSIINGSFFATGWELFAALRCGLVSNVHFVRVYTPKGTRDFADYVTHFYRLKKEAANVSERDFAKLFLNSAYGKFSQNVRNFTEVRITKYREYPAAEMKSLGWTHSYDDENRGLSFYQKPTYDADGRNSQGRHMQFYNVSTAASITGWVRAFLMESMHRCGGVVYCDTDSVIARDVSNLKTGAELGEWKLEMECDAVHIGGKKLYAAHAVTDLGHGTKADGDFVSAFGKHYRTKKDFEKSWKKASKGVRLTVEQICRVCEGQSETYSFEAPNYSVFSPPRFTTRTVRRDDKRKTA